MQMISAQPAAIMLLAVFLWNDLRYAIPSGGETVSVK